ncbi:hypothetical protein THAOC_26512 [Thalassiosira oceanica]|uniref:Uncharacterized protein n=1 Tax=Thalassiosira oceanica TaxID=159749 RepID=K0RL84_THAOC|nr:hypothetical protein THAOC_26512 [Thalassiosira oceanica]|eukprot:EJK53950.1 hypothetical protein THAOC_26512 [Thalassiosira oceanica]
MGERGSVETIKEAFKAGAATKEQYAEALKGYQDATQETKSHDRDEAKAFLDNRKPAKAPNYRQASEIWADVSRNRSRTTASDGVSACCQSTRTPANSEYSPTSGPSPLMLRKASEEKAKQKIEFEETRYFCLDETKPFAVKDGFAWTLREEHYVKLESFLQRSIRNILNITMTQVQEDHIKREHTHTNKTHLDEAPFGPAGDDNGPGSEMQPHDHFRYVEMVDPPIFAPSSLPDAAVYGGTGGIGHNLHNPGIPALCPAPASPDRRPTDFGPRSLPDATAPKGSEDKGYNVRNQGIPTQCPA